jgi:hypothetical protein
MTTDAPSPTPAHALLALIFSERTIPHDARSAFQAWRALGLNESGVAADGDTDLIFALRHARPYVHEDQLLQLLEHAPQAGWLKGADGQDALDFAAKNNHTRLLHALLSLPQKPAAAVLQTRPWGEEKIPLQTDTIPHGLARRGWNQTLKIWIEDAGAPLPTVWAEANGTIAQLLVQHGVPCPEGLESWWQQSLRNKTMSAQDLTTVMQLSGQTASNTEASSLQLEAYFQALKNNRYTSHNEPEKMLKTLEHPERIQVSRKGVDGKLTAWSLLGATVWDLTQRLVENDLTSANRLAELLPTLMGEAPDLPFCEGLPAAPMLALMAYGLGKGGLDRLSTVTVDRVTQWANQSLPELLTEAQAAIRLLAQSPQSAVKRTQLFFRCWQGVSLHWATEHEAVKARDPALAAAMDVVVHTTWMDPALGRGLWRSTDSYLWAKGAETLVESLQHWLATQPDHWALLAAQLLRRSEDVILQKATQHQMQTWLNQGERPALDNDTVVTYLREHAPALLAQLRQEQASDEPDAPARRRRFRT